MSVVSIDVIYVPVKLPGNSHERVDHHIDRNNVGYDVGVTMHGPHHSYSGGYDDACRAVHVVYPAGHRILFRCHY